MTEWMFQDVYDVEEWYVCSSSSHQARCDVALTWDTRGLRATSGHRGAHTMTSGCGQDAMRE